MSVTRAAGITLTHFKKYVGNVTKFMSPEVRRAFNVVCNELKRMSIESDDKDCMKITLDTVETDRASKFMEKHVKSCRCGNNPYHSGVTFHYILSGTGLGWGTTIKCMNCKKKEDITNIESW